MLQSSASRSVGCVVRHPALHRAILGHTTCELLFSCFLSLCTSIQVISPACVQAYSLQYCQQQVVNDLTQLQLSPPPPITVLNNTPVVPAPSSSMSVGAIVGAVVGSVVGGLLLTAIVACVAVGAR